MIDEILTEALERIEKEQKLHPDDHTDVQDLLNDLKNQMREIIVFWNFPTLEQLKVLEQKPCTKLILQEDD